MRLGKPLTNGKIKFRRMLRVGFHVVSFLLVLIVKLWYLKVGSIMLMNLLFSLIGNQLPRTASSDLQKALLLIENLQAGDFLSFVNTLYFPETIDNCKISPVLNFDRHEQKKELDTLRPRIQKDLLKVTLKDVK